MRSTDRHLRAHTHTRTQKARRKKKNSFYIRLAVLLLLRHSIMSDSVFGFSGQDFVLVAADTATARSIVVLKNDEDKIIQVDDNKVFATNGDAGDRVQFCEYIRKNLDLYRYRNDLQLTTRAVANFTRKELAEALRRNPYNVNLLLAGWDAEEGAALFYMDYLASMHKVPFGAHGYCGYFLSSLLDRYWKPDITRDQAKALADRCIDELKQRFLLNTVDFSIKLVDRDGIHHLKGPGSGN